MNDTDPDNYVSNGEAAKILGISPSTMQRWARKGHIRYLRNPKTGWRYFRAGDVYTLRDSLREVSGE
ncbi:helix-turn-helix domain-containing protein [Allosalinactinospora lopnorensis]|uniref:helix-turn-helix domain-containing protein n=1 Tax=Allosalinactinospora lopnorensis TaxID=1352348 RepID=UPI000623C0E3|nr:helix-turn-helix domain-containing protein [Allosalinactinospora lopnorensis]